MSKVCFIAALSVWGIQAAEDPNKISFLLFDFPEKIEPYKVSLSAADIVGSDPNDNLCRSVRSLNYQNDPKLASVSNRELDVSSTCQLMTKEGNDIETFAQIEEDMHVYVIPDGRYHIWPTYELGHMVTVPELKEDDDAIDEIRLETISQEPRIFRLHNFLSPTELKTLQEQSDELELERSTGGIAKKGTRATNGGQYNSPLEYVYDAPLRYTMEGDTEFSLKLKRKATTLLRIRDFDKERYGGLQIVNYGEGQFYDFHQDWLSIGTTENWNWNPRTGGSNRMATVFMYLTDTELGGSTGFPQSTAPPPPMDQEEYDAITERQNELFNKSDIEYRVTTKCRDGFHVRPRAGDAILFYHQDRLGNLDPRAIHGACPVMKGTKRGANLWIWNGRMFTHDRAEGKGESIDVQFINLYNEAVHWYWVKWEDPDDPENMDLVSNGVYEHGTMFPSGTYTGHSFVAKTLDGKLIEKYEMKAGVTRYELTRQQHSEL